MQPIANFQVVKDLRLPLVNTTSYVLSIGPKRAQIVGIFISKNGADRFRRSAPRKSLVGSQAPQEVPNILKICACNWII